VKDELVKQWAPITRRTIERYIRVVEEENRKDYEASRREALPEIIAQMRKLYELCLKEKQYAAAWKYSDRMIRMYGLDVRKVELTGAQGQPIQVQQQQIDLSNLTDAQLDVLGALFDDKKEKEEKEEEIPSPDTTTH
jgi:hypothetical protein